MNVFSLCTSERKRKELKWLNTSQIRSFYCQVFNVIMLQRITTARGNISSRFLILKRPLQKILKKCFLIVVCQKQMTKDFANNPVRVTYVSNLKSAHVTFFVKNAAVMMLNKINNRTVVYRTSSPLVEQKQYTCSALSNYHTGVCW